MQDLIRLAGVVAENTPNTLPVVDNTDSTSLEGRFYQLLRQKEAHTDEDACAMLYGNSEVTSSYRMLKSRVRKKLLNNLFFVEISERHVKISKKLLLECHATLLQANKLLALQEYVLAEKLVDQVISMAQKAELNDVLANAYEFKQQRDLLTQDRGRFEKNLKLMQRYHLLDAKEKEALGLFNQLKFEISVNISNMRKQGAAYFKSLMKLRELWDQTGSSSIYNKYYLINIGYQEIIGNYDQILENIAEAEALLADKKLNPFWFNHHFTNYIKVFAYLRLRKIEEGLRAAKTSLDLYKEGTVNWFAFLENYVALVLHGKYYKTAVELCNMAISKGKDGFEAPKMQETWLLIERYVRLVSHKAGAKLSHTLMSDEAEPSIISRDKDGYNLPLLIVDYLEQLPHLGAEELEQYVGRFEKYIVKYLKGHAATRARLILKLLIVSMKEDARNLEKKGARHYRKLLATPPTRDPLAEVEIIPYEHLWEIAQERALLRITK